MDSSADRCLVAPLKVAHVITLLELGGAQEITLHQVAHLPRARFQPLLVAGRGGMLDAEAAAIPGLGLQLLPSLVREVRPGSDLRALLALRRLFRAERPRIVHTHSSKAGILGRLAARMAGVPVIVHSIHGFGFHDRQRRPVRAAYILAEKAAARVTQGFTADAQANLETGKSHRLFRRSRTIVLRCAIEPERLAATPAEVQAVRRELGIAPGQRVVGMVGCLKPQKAPLDFVRAAARVRQRCPETAFFLAGDGELRPAVEEEIRRLGLGGALRLLGWRRDVPALLHLADVVALSSLWEGLPRVFPQAMACGKPIVATRVDGAPEAVAEGVSGFLVEPGRPEALAERIALLLENDDLRQRMGRAAGERVAEFTTERMMEELVRFYEEMLAAAGIALPPATGDSG